NVADHAIVVPGETITAEPGFIRGHGTYMTDPDEDQDEEGQQNLVAAVAGVVERVNKLISVRPIKSRYIGEVGDLVVGRITAIGMKRWSVDIHSNKSAILMLSSVNLPGGVQRIRTYEDQLQMRSFYQEDDLISAEVQNIMSDGSVSLHTRSLKYGKLENGLLVTVQPSLIKRLKQHFITLPFGVDVILGTNGFIWITRSIEQGAASSSADDSAPLAEVLQQQRQVHASTPILPEAREKICRVRNSVEALSQVYHPVDPDAIVEVYNASLSRGFAAKDMLQGDNILSITEGLRL
ncbi:unnamed protein product, partial [Heterosigma akashiwo]